MCTLITQHYGQTDGSKLRLGWLACCTTLMAFSAGCYEAPAPPPMTEFDIAPSSSAERPEASLRPTEQGPPELPTRLESTSSAAEEASPTFDTSDGQPWISADRLPWMIDYVQYFNGRQIGFSHIEVHPAAVVANQLRVVRTDSIEFTVGGQASRAEVKLEAVEKDSGRLIDLKIETLQGGVHTAREGFLKEENLSLKTTITPTPEVAEPSKKVVWQEGAWGTLGIQSLLLREPIMVPGERRIARVFIPSLMEIAQVELLAGTKELTPLVGGKTPELLPIEVGMWTETSGMRSRNWINDRGEIEKTLALTGPSVTTFRVPRAITLRLESAVRMESMLAHTIPLQSKPVKEADEVNAMRDRTYAIDTKQRDLGFLLRSSRQKVVSKTPYEADITIFSELPAAATTSAAVDAPAPADLQPNTWLPANHPTMASLAEEMLGELTLPAEVASQLTRAVAQRIAPQELDTRLASVLETARNRVGDCVDRALLLTTLLRSRGIPARVRSGMWLDTTALPVFRYHMWTEAWIDSQWQAFDPSLGGPVGLGHIAMAHEPLGEDNPYEAIVPVLEALQDIERINVEAQLRPREVPRN